MLRGLGFWGLGCGTGGYWDYLGMYRESMRIQIGIM